MAQRRKQLRNCESGSFVGIITLLLSIVWIYPSFSLIYSFYFIFKQEALVLLLDVSPSMHNILQEVEKVCSMLIQKKVPISLCECFLPSILQHFVLCFLFFWLGVDRGIEHRGRIVHRYCWVSVCCQEMQNKSCSSLNIWKLMRMALLVSRYLLVIVGVALVYLF